MRCVLLSVMISLVLTACALWPVEPYPELIEVQKERVTRCSLLGVVTETANAANPFAVAAATAMVSRVRERSSQLGATHIVWLHKTATMATAEAYLCQ